MNYSVCPTHSDRKQEMVCLSDDCELRFSPQCVQCIMVSKCRQSHHWKMITEAIEEIHEICETAQIKSQKRQGSQSNIKSNPINQTHKTHIQDTLQEMGLRIEELKSALVANIQRRANKLLLKASPAQNHTKVKQLLKNCKKQVESNIFNSSLKDVGNFLKCIGDGSLELLESATEEIRDIDISIFENEANKILDNVSYIIIDDGEMPSQENAIEKNYEKQIDKLLDQLKELPVLQNRIQSLTEKLQIKDAKLKKLEGGSPSIIKEDPDTILKKKSSLEEGEATRLRNTTRIQNLIQRRKQLFNAFQQYIKKNPQQQLYIYNLKPGENAVKLEIPTSSNVTYLFNQNSLAICDELQFLGYSDSTSGQQTVEIPLISLKKQQPKPKMQVDAEQLKDIFKMFAGLQ